MNKFQLDYLQEMIDKKFAALIAPLHKTLKAEIPDVVKKIQKTADGKKLQFTFDKWENAKNELILAEKKEKTYRDELAKIGDASSVYSMGDTDFQGTKRRSYWNYYVFSEAQRNTEPAKLFARAFADTAFRELKELSTEGKEIAKFEAQCEDAKGKIMLAMNLTSLRKAIDSINELCGLDLSV